MFLNVVLAIAQRTDSSNIEEPIKVLVRTSVDSLVLRWAPLDVSHWIEGNNNGYTIERITLVRDGKVLSQPERKEITTSLIRPWPEARWESIVNNNKYAAVAAQALLGEKFEVDMDQADLFQVVNKARENEQRYSIALYCADMSPVVARALGLYFVDRDVKKEEKYLYKITCTPIGRQPFSGSIYVNMDEQHQLPAPLNFSIKVDGPAVSLKWNQSYHLGIYTAYQVERSEDGQNFKPISEDPTLVLSNNGEDLRFQYANDTLPDLTKEFSYRVRGISPFGELGPPTEILKAKGKKTIVEIPAITSAASVDNKTILVTWEFPHEYDKDIQGFFVERSASASGAYKRIHDNMIPAMVRDYTDQSPAPVNYYRIAVLASGNDKIRSMPYFTHLVDSVPPSTPTGVKGGIDEYGNVKLSWLPNKDSDIFGYRIYRSYYLSEEFSQITSQPLEDTAYHDKVQLQSLNEKIHYTVMAIDRNQNHSSLSEVFTLTLPDKVPPVPPVFLPIVSSQNGVELRWMPSSSIDVIRYDLYRKGDQNQWIRITSITANSDTLYYYFDKNIQNNTQQVYTVIAIDEGQLESPPSEAVTGTKLKTPLKPAINKIESIVDRSSGKLTLKWIYEGSGIQAYKIYRATNGEPLKLHKTILTREFIDAQLNPGKSYKYQIMVLFTDGSMSAFSEAVELTF
jgi:fibronectin type 3 domain-containing protein